MKQFLVTESERIEILKRHRSLLKEAPVTDEQRLQAGLDAKCFGTPPIQGGVGPVKTNSGQWVYSKPSKSKPGQYVRYLPNSTYYFYDPANKSNPFSQPVKFSCPAMENLGVPTEQEKTDQYNIETLRGQNWKTMDDLIAAKEPIDGIDTNAGWEKKKVGNVTLYRRVDVNKGGMSTKDDPNDALRKQWIEYLGQRGYTPNPSVTERQELQYYNLYDLNIEGLEPGVFPPSQKVWYDPSKDRFKVDLATRQQKSEVSKDVCKQRIEAFYQEFMNNRGNTVIPDRVGINRAKTEVRYCINRYEGKWGLFGKDIKNKIDTLQGNTAESPSSSGVDSIFRL